MRICSGAGCLRAVPDDARLCDECKPLDARPDDIRVHTLTDRERYAFLYSSTRWQRTRAAVIKAHPFCAMCESNITEIIDHIVPAGVAIVQAQDSGLYRTDRYAGFFLRSNLQGLCRVCHAKKTDEDKGHTGPWRDVVTVEQAMPRRVWSFG